VITLVAQYVLLAFVFRREDMWVYISHLLIASIPLVLYWLTYCCPAGGRLLLSVARGGEVISADAELPDAVVHTRRREEAENRGWLSVLAYVSVAYALRCIELLADVSSGLD